MFPRSFNARVAQRMVIWGAMVGFLLFLYAATEVIQAWKMAAIATEMRGAIAAAALSETEAGKAAATALDAAYGRESALLANNRQNKLLIALLALFVVGQFLVREYRWLVDPMVKMAGVLKSDGSSGGLGTD